MSRRNYGLGSRFMYDAGVIALKSEMDSFSSIDTMSHRWAQFCYWAEIYGYKKMEDITRADLINYGMSLAERVADEELSPATAQNYLSVANCVFRIARGDKEVWASPTRDCGIAKRSGIAKVSKAMPQDFHENLQHIIDARVYCLMELQRKFGLRFEESCKIDAARAFSEALANHCVTIIKGTKGGRKRVIPITNDLQITVLSQAAAIQGKDRSMIPKTMQYVQFQGACYREARKFEVHFHAERHWYAQVRYQMLSGVDCPVVAGINHGRDHIQYICNVLNISTNEATDLDTQTRLQIALELGHNRKEITNGYLG